MATITVDLRAHPIADEAAEARRNSLAKVRGERAAALDNEATRELFKQAQIVSATIHESINHIADGEFSKANVHDPNSWMGELQSYATRCAQWLQEHSPEQFTEIKNIISMTIQDKMHEMKKNISPETRRMFANVVFSVCLIAFATFIQAMVRGESWSDCFKLSFLSTLPGSIMSIVSAFIQNFIDANGLARQAVKSVGVACSQEITENVLTAIAGGLVGFTIGLLWDLLTICLESKNERQTWWQYLAAILTNLKSKGVSMIEKNIALAGASGVIAFLCPAWATICICFALPVIFGQVEEERRMRGNTSFLWTAGELTLRGLVYIPVSVWSVLTAVPARRPTVIYPEILCCEITYDLLEDPVFLGGVVCSRRVAADRVRATAMNFYNVPATMADIVPLPMLAVVVAKARDLY